MSMTKFGIFWKVKEISFYLANIIKINISLSLKEINLNTIKI